MDKKSNFNLQLDNMYTFVRAVFNDGCVPKTREEFIQSLSTETTDGSLCMAYDFGERGKDETAMIFFYQYDCAVPLKYRDHLKEQYRNPYGLLFLNNNYMYMSCANTSSVDFLNKALVYVEAKQEAATMLLRTDIRTNKNMYSEEEAKKRNEDALKSIMEYELGSLRLINYIKNRINQVSSSASGGMQADFER